MGEVPLGDVLRHVDLALNGMCDTVESLGDERVNLRPDLPGANSPYVIVRHCCGVMEHWGATELAGRTTDRDRDAEFSSSGTVAELVALVRAQRRRLELDLAEFDGASPALRAGERDGFRAAERAAVATRGGVLMHIYEELAQHRGHLDVTADLLRAASGRAPSEPDLHFTDYDTRLAAYAAIVDDQQRILLSWWNGEGFSEPMWTMPGGGVDFGERVEDAIVREVHEETGYTVELGELLVVDTYTRSDPGWGRPRRFQAVRVVHHATVVGGTLGTLEVDGTTDDAQWIPLDEVADHPRTSLVDVVLDALKGRRASQH